jgi:hypothetical protein
VGDGENPVHRPGQIDGRGAGGLQPFRVGLEGREKRGGGFISHRLCQGVGGGNANGGGAPHCQGADRLHRRIDVVDMQELLVFRKGPLIQDREPPGMPSDGWGNHARAFAR